jgi:hypothetical protein
MHGTPPYRHMNRGRRERVPSEDPDTAQAIAEESGVGDLLEGKPSPW